MSSTAVYLVVVARKGQTLRKFSGGECDKYHCTANKKEPASALLEVMEDDTRVLESRLGMHVILLIHTDS